MGVRIRVDDFPFTKVDEWDTGRYSLEKFQEFDACIPRRYLLGIIPWNCNLRDVQLQMDRERIVPGLHGFWHSEARQNEFEGLSVQEIEGYLYSGRIMVEGCCGQDALDVSVYMPPHNVVDMTTVVACRRSGIRKITGGPETDPLMPTVMRNYGVSYIPSQPPVGYGRSDELVQRGAVPFLRESAEAGRDVVLGLHWTWESSIGLDSLRWLMTQIDDVLVDF